MKLVEVKKYLLSDPNINRKYYILVDIKKEFDEQKINTIIDKEAYIKAESDNVFSSFPYQIDWKIIENKEIKRDLMYKRTAKTLIRYDNILKEKNAIYEQLKSILKYNIIDYKIENDDIYILEDKKGWIKINI